MLLIGSTFGTFDQFRRPLRQEDTDELSDDSQPSSPSQEREAKDWWRASEPPEETFSDVDEGQEWRYQIIGEEIDPSSKIWCISSIHLLFSTSF